MLEESFGYLSANPIKFEDLLTHCIIYQIICKVGCVCSTVTFNVLKLDFKQVGPSKEFGEHQ